MAKFLTLDGTSYLVGKIKRIIPSLSSSTDSDSETVAATPKAVKTAYDLASEAKEIAEGKQSKQTTLSGYGITDAYTKTEVDNKLTSAMMYKGSVANYAELETLGDEPKVGDVYNVANDDPTHNIKAGDNVAWSGTVWDNLGSYLDLSGFVSNTDVITDDDIDNLFPEITN